ncbi:MAG: hypothetical protein GY938_18035 [Ketobacter sp.]|nr:hypothetical protein [Ketobacter sp.]
MSVTDNGGYKFGHPMARDIAAKGIRVPHRGAIERLNQKIECLQSGIDLIGLYQSRYTPTERARAARTLADLGKQLADNEKLKRAYLATPRHRRVAA